MKLLDWLYTEPKIPETGFAVWYDQDGAVFENYYKNGLRCGHGKVTFSDGTNYIGGWKDDWYWGEGGILTFADGRVCEGEFLNGAMHGEGTCSGDDWGDYDG